MRTTTLGPQGSKVGIIGLGCMGSIFSTTWQPRSRFGVGTNDRVVQLVADDLTWIVTCDARIAVGVRRIRDADLTNSVPLGSSSADSGGGSGHGVGMRALHPGDDIQHP